LHLAVLAVIQGLTEFLPISSSGHLVLVPHVLGWPDQGLVIDVAVHVGTFGAVLVFFWRDIGRMILGLLQALQGRGGPGLRLFLQLVLGSLPLIAAGYMISRYLGDTLRSVEVIGWATVGFGVLLGIADKIGMTIRRMEHMGYGSVLIIGFAQVLAFIPGASRSGVTMMAARAIGFERPDAARFSLLLSIPAILGAGTLQGMKVYEAGDLSLGLDAAIAAGIAFATALVSISLMMAWLRRAGFMPFVIYRLLLGGALLVWVYL
jgi:undecaprenyl-diphosphatase